MTENTEVGQVQWFDHKKGFGFIECIKPGTDWYGKKVFFHWSEIKCDSSFKKLMPGEIVTFFVGKKSEDDQKDLCKNIRPIYDAKFLIDNEKYIYKVREKISRDRHEGTAFGNNNESVDESGNVD